MPEDRQDSLCYTVKQQQNSDLARIFYVQFGTSKLFTPASLKNINSCGFECDH